LTAANTAGAPLKAYWQPGCTSCLRMKEFLTLHAVPFVSVNVWEDANGLAELAALGAHGTGGA
jgi:Glutaredoxin